MKSLQLLVMTSKNKCPIDDSRAGEQSIKATKTPGRPFFVRDLLSFLLRAESQYNFLKIAQSSGRDVATSPVLPHFMTVSLLTQPHTDNKISTLFHHRRLESSGPDSRIRRGLLCASEVVTTRSSTHPPVT